MPALIAWFRGLSILGKFSKVGLPIVILLGTLWQYFGPKPAPVTPPAPSAVAPPETKQGTIVQGSPNATTIQSGRDTIIVNPPPKPPAPVQEVPPTKKQEAAPSKAVPSQTMINSPGGIQAGGNVTVNADRRFIQTLMLRVVMELETAPSPVTKPGDPTMNMAFGPGVGLFTQDATLYRLASEGQFKGEQIAPTLRRYTFVYKPESEEQLLGKPIELLATVDRLGINATGFLEMVGGRSEQTLGRAGASVDFTLFTNGVPVATGRGLVKPTGALATGEMTMNVRDAFAQIPAKYSTVASR